MNHGLLIQNRHKCSDDFFGGVSRIASFEKLNNSGQWTDWLPVGEKQSNPFFDTMACVSYSAANCIEILQKFLWGNENNYSDRALAKLSGTTQMGNYMYVVADTIRNKGLIDEEKWPMYGFTWAEYMETVPENIEKLGRYFVETYEVNYEFVQTNQIKEALKFAPLQVMVYAWPTPIDGIYPDRPEKPRNHAVTLVGYKNNEYWLVFDHYQNFVKKLEWNYKFGGTLKYSIKLNNISFPMFKNNTLLQQVTGEGAGGFGLYLEEKLFVDKPDKIIATFIMRNKGDISGRCEAVVEEVWNKFPKFNLKGEAL